MDIRSGTILDGPNQQQVTVESLIGRGGFGQVFSGRLPDGTLVAIKTVLTATLGEHELRTFQNEARLALGLEHPNVVRVLYVYDGDADQGRPPYLVMEFIDGGDLRKLIEAQDRDGKRTPLEELQGMFQQIAAGMEAVNTRLVHRDLKPDNVLIDGTTGMLKIADFGLAKLADAATRSGTFKGWGTRPYQAPEAFENGPNTPAMDVYAAGVMFYELATGIWPIQPNTGDNTPMAWRNAHLLSAPKDVRSFRPDLPIGLVQLIMQMLEKNPARRPQSFTVVRERLARGLDASAAKRPDISALLSKATTSFIEETEAATRARQERERAAERRALLIQAYSEPVGVLKEVVEAYNAATELTKLKVTQSELTVEVVANAGKPRLAMRASVIDDLSTHYDGIVRITATVGLEPAPRPRSEREMIQDRDSFGSFNLVYRVSRAEERFGSWTQFRFERSPLTATIEYPRWHAAPDLLREMQVLRAMGLHQHEQRPLDGEWFTALLLQMV